MRFLKNAHPNKVKFFCEGEGLTTNDTSKRVFEDVDWCAGGTLDVDQGAWASVPYFDLALTVSCENSTLCTAVIPSHFTDEALYQALMSIGEYLQENTEFREKVFTSDADNPRDFVADWVAAGTPSYEEVREWFCNPPDDATAVHVQTFQQWDGEVEILDEVRDTGLFPEVFISLRGPTYRVAVVNSRCIDSIEFV